LELGTFEVKKLLYIARIQALAVLLLMLLALAPAMAQIAVPKNVVYQGDTTTLSVTEFPYETYSWELYNDSTVDFAQTPGACPTNLADFVGGNIGHSVQVEWKEPGIYFYKVTAWNITGCTNNLRIGVMKVLEALPKAVLEVNPDSICEGEWADLTVEFSARGPWSMKLQAKDLKTGIASIEIFKDIQETDNPFHIPVGPKTTTEYTVIEVSNKFGVQTEPSNLVKLTVHPLPPKTPIYLKKP
jgi:hypothetical protein